MFAFVGWRPQYIENGFSRHRGIARWHDGYVSYRCAASRRYSAMTIVVLLVAPALGLSVAMMAAWAIATRSGRSGWIDAIWSFAVGVAGVVAALVPLQREPTTRQVLVAGLATAWSLRLGGHIARRTRGGGGDDPRYAWLRKEWGAEFCWRLFGFLQIQAACGFLLAVSIMVAAYNPAL